ncbi:MAG: TonB-dependent receptor [Porticoccaceae bacterium]|jgi:iron complex outermembrane recepter protein|nr:TonB-dependent receptor [Porticoccaceae bacterium]
MNIARNIVSKLTALIAAVVLIGSNTLVISQAGAQEIEEVFVLGSRALGRTAADLPVPVDNLTSEAMETTGQTEVGRMLQVLAPSFNFSSSSISDGTDALRPATLRGLGPDQTLVLVNGKRRHQASLIHINTSVGRGTAGTDMNAIPATSIKRIEVLRDGAAAQYGSDAIGGVINIVLNDDDTAGRFSISQGQYSEGDGATTNIDLSKGFAFGDSGWLNLALNMRDRENTNRAAPQGGCLYGGCVDTDGNGFLEPAPGNETLEVSGPGRDGFRIGDADSEQTAFTLNAGTELGEGELYGFVTYSTRDNESGAFHRNPTGSNGVDSALLTDGLNPADTNGFLPLIQSEIQDMSYSVGYRMDFEDASFDISLTTGENTIDYTTANSANYSYANFLQFDQGLSDAEIRSTIPRSAKAYGLELGLTTLNLDFTKQYDQLSLAAGAEYRNDAYKVIAGDEYSYFDYDSDPVTGLALYAQNAGGSIQGFNGIGPESEVDETRSVISFYLDGEYQVTDDWMVSAAARFDEYDGFGDTVNIKLATNFAISDTLRLRAATSTGFRAPSMQQLYFNNISTQIRAAGAVTVGTFRNNSAAVQALGVPELKEEESTNYSLGVVADLGGWNVAVDYYSIDIDDRIGISNQLDAGVDPENNDGDPLTDDTGAIATALASVGAEAAQFFLNGMNTETSGFDIVSTYSGMEFADGNLDLTLAANFTETEVTDIFVPNAGALSSVDPSEVISAQDISIIEEWQPQDRISLSGLYTKDQWTVNLAFNRFGEYTVVDSSPQTYSAEILTDLYVKYSLSDNMSLSFTGNNIFDVTPDETTNTGSRGGSFESAPGAEDLASPTVFRYSRRSAPFGFNGAYYAVGLSYNF